MTTPDTTTPATPPSEAPLDESTTTAGAETVEPAAAEVTSEAQADTQSLATETATTPAPAAEAPAGTAVATAVATETAVASLAAEDEEEDPQTTVFSLVTFFLAALPVIGVVLNAIAVARAGKEGFDLWLARWGLALAILETVGALALVALGYWLGFATASA
ncbi:hypothetical protein ACFQHV_12200 [Promicromonospora thailandica]|uniref:DUF4190 domain-containing protein n=1 Tax=Promicromonospora thailandica TaxID=765201 RepID=A0A9X2G158_9MICO|nr:hypothetical protein [Promicromonospora thailandica]MCP2265147.1 hypothetical protein [Promicromonospora thailandica]BFF19780.1 hypothetical protein GCM10025730_33010 [Promicromonospora thailandica]